MGATRRASSASMLRPASSCGGLSELSRAIELTPDKFDQYLGEEGLDEIRSLAIASKKMNRPAHELYAVRQDALLLASGNPAAGTRATDTSD